MLCVTVSDIFNVVSVLSVYETLQIKYIVIFCLQTLNDHFIAGTHLSIICRAMRLLFLMRLLFPNSCVYCSRKWFMLGMGSSCYIKTDSCLKMQ